MIMWSAVRSRSYGTFYAKLQICVNSEFLREKLLPYRLSHKGDVDKVKFNHGAIHILFAKFLMFLRIYISLSFNIFLMMIIFG